MRQSGSIQCTRCISLKVLAERTSVGPPANKRNCQDAKEARSLTLDVKPAAGDIALVKGWMFAEGHEPCLHRSPPIAGTGERRLLLAIDTPRIDPENRR